MLEDRATLRNYLPRNDSEIVTMLRQELERQRQENERQRLEMKEENEGLKTQISRLTETVMQSLSAQPKPKGKK